ncbi:hypothetical protein DPMN_145115 [Dreissena polymorpha]|uniref:Uncharacterized protein n=1 Tax=Dreissena polymorpha TaxID=45954 RepID=A0A9D4F990_DREPO|nr:hypothetical protein DPMN_145115 [Dreissena polymorpha]
MSDKKVANRENTMPDKELVNGADNARQKVANRAYNARQGRSYPSGQCPTRE